MFAGYAADFPPEVGRSIPGEIHLGPGSNEVVTRPHFATSRKMGARSQPLLH